MSSLGAFLLGMAQVSGPALANPPPAEHSFTVRPPLSEERIKVTEATFDDELCFHVKGFASDGEHVYEIVVFDASGRETLRVTAPVLAKGAVWRGAICPSAKKDVDAPGEWWFVATIDDTPVISASISMGYGKRRTRDQLKTSPKPAPAQRAPAQGR